MAAPPATIPFPESHVRPLLDAGYPLTAISRAAGLAASTLIVARRRGTVTRPVLHAVTHVDMNRAPCQPAWRATRRVRALAAAGMRYQHIADEVGTGRSYIAMIANARFTRMETSTFLKIDEVWQSHKDRPVTTPDPKIIRRGWAVPWEWDDIDDPATDLHGDAFVPSTPVIESIDRTIATHGLRAVCEATGMDPNRIQRLRAAGKTRLSTRATVLGNLQRLRSRTAMSYERACAA